MHIFPSLYSEDREQTVSILGFAVFTDRLVLAGKPIFEAGISILGSALSLDLDLSFL